MNCDIIYDTIYVTNLCRYTENNAKILFLPTLACKHVISCNQNIVRLLDFDPGLISIMSNPKKTRLQKKKKKRKKMEEKHSKNYNEDINPLYYS